MEPGVAFAGPLPLALAPLLTAGGCAPLEPSDDAASDAASRVTPSGLTSRRTLEPEQAAAVELEGAGCKSGSTVAFQHYSRQEGSDKCMHGGLQEIWQWGDG